MKALLMGMHPTFEALSAHADRPDLDGARTRVGAHVARCAQCRAVVEEIRGLGDAARAMPEAGLPADLWSRIATTAASDADRAEPGAHPARPTPPPDGDVWRQTPALRPTRHMPSIPRSWVARVGIVAAAAAVIGIALLLPSSRSALHASAPARLTVFPARPRPGTTVTVRYQADPAMAGASRLLLLAAFAPSADSADQEGYWWAGLQDSIATLERNADGMFVGQWRVPEHFLAASLFVVPTGLPPTRQPLGPKWWEESGSYERQSTLLVGATQTGSPSLESLLAALRVRTFLVTRSRGQVADTLRKYFPDHPAGYAAAVRRERHGVLDDLVHFFRSEERDYARLDGILSERPRVDADRLLGMAEFARRIEEPAMAAKWVMRLVKEHPDDPRTLGAYAEMVHAIELREPPADTMRRYLPMFDSLYERGGGRGESNYEVAALIKRYGDRAMYDRWVIRGLRSRGLHYYGIAMDDESLRRPEVRALAEPRLRRITADRCALPPGKYPSVTSVSVWQEQCHGSRAMAYGFLSRMELFAGDPRRALADADSSAAANVARGSCWRNIGERRRGEALVALGDLPGAAISLSRAYAWDEVENNKRRDSVGRSLRPVVDSARWASLVAAGRAEHEACSRRAFEQRKAAADSARR